MPLSSRELLASWWEQFCEDIAKQKIKTIESLANLTTLYEGRGGQVIEEDGLLEPSIDQDGAPGLPAYEETDTSIPRMRPAKRKEPYDESSTIGQTAQSTKRNKPYDESFTIGQTAQLTDSTVMEEIIRVIDAKLAAHRLMVQDMLAAHKDEVAKMIESVEADLPYKIKEEVEKEADEVKEYVMERIASMPVQAYFTFADHPYL